MRLDKFLKVSRVIKRRTVAHDACDGQRVKVNGKTAKPAHQIKVGDILDIAYGNHTLQIRIKEISEHVKKQQAESMYEILSGSDAT